MPRRLSATRMPARIILCFGLLSGSTVSVNTAMAQGALSKEPQFVKECPPGSQFEYSAGSYDRREYCLDENGRKVGRYHSENLARTEDGEYRDGAKHGRWVITLKSGAREEEEYNEGKKSGIWKWFDASGILRKQITYEKETEVAWSGADYDEAIADAKVQVSTVRVELSGQPGTIIPAGSWICTKTFVKDQIIFKSIVPVRIPKSGKIETLFAAGDNNPDQSLKKGALNKICTPISGWRGAVSLADTVPATGEVAEIEAEGEEE